ncbi:MAG: tRNA pseudouridine(55) synthase TruB [Desulfovibrio sp.]|nr:tRNA pseudouridine(55) synthase TruB [Desulfovibrio sp.]
MREERHTDVHGGEKYSLPQLHGVLVLNKPKGLSSNRCIMHLKRLGQKKIGHAGTLDPLATGVLLVLLGQATKISGYLLEDGGKTYSGTLRLGQTTDTWDSEGKVLTEEDCSFVTEAMLRREITAWEGISEQPVPPFSAAKLNGQPLYKLARKGTMVERTKTVYIEHAGMLEADLPFARFRVRCHSGTYIRSLAHSLGMRLRCGAVLTELTREYSHPFGLESAVALSDLLADPSLLLRVLHPIRDALPSWPAIDLSDTSAELVENGCSIPLSSVTEVEGDRAILMHGEREIALAERLGEGKAAVWKVLRGLTALASETQHPRATSP